MKQWLRQNGRNVLLAGGVSAIAAVCLILFLVRPLLRIGNKKTEEFDYYIEGMSELTPEEAEALARREAAKQTLTGLGNVESMAGLASDGKWVVDEPGDGGWSLSRPAPFFMKIRFDRNYEMITEEDTAMWRRKYKGEYLWDTDAVYAYFETLRKKYETTPGEVLFTTHDGRLLRFQSDNCGWQMNVDQTVEALKAAAENGEEVMDPVWNSGLVYCSANGVGSKYVEVDIPAQKVFLYEDGKLILQTDCVTGTKNFTDTVAGVFQVMYKASPSVLKDEDIYGNKYEQPVNYWISFNYSQGMHDALWRSVFGGDIYLSSGSHGCVNLPEDAAAKIYNEVYNYYPVVVYDEYIEEVKENAEESLVDETEADSDAVFSAVDEAGTEGEGSAEISGDGLVQTSAGLPDNALA